MHTKVVFQGAKALTRIGCAVLRFNFRGVGGALEHGMRDAARKTTKSGGRLFRRTIPGRRAVGGRLLVRFAHCLTCGAEDDRVCALIGIAPPVDRYDYGS